MTYNNVIMHNIRTLEKVYHKPNDKIVGYLPYINSVIFNKLRHQYTNAELTALRDLEIICRVAGRKAEVSTHELATLIEILALTCKKLDALTAEGILLGDTLTVHNVILSISEMAYMMKEVYTVAQTHEGSLHFPVRLNEQQCVYIYNLVDTINRKAYQINKLLINTSYKYSLETQGKGVTVDVYKNWTSHLERVHAVNVNLSKKEPVQEWSYEEEVRKETEKALEKARQQGYTNVKVQNGVLYDMNAINAGYNEIARIGQVGKVKKPKEQKEGKGFLGRLFSR